MRGFILILTFFCFSCNSKKSNERKYHVLVHREQDTFKTQVKQNNRERILVKDTILIFSIENLSAEGSQVKAHYINDTIGNAIWNIYGETGQSIIYYKFLNDGTIKVKEKNYIYKTNLVAVNSKNDMNLKSSLQYLMDRNGLLLTKINDKNFVNVFEDFKKQVPMVLFQVPEK